MIFQGDISFRTASRSRVKYRVYLIYFYQKCMYTGISDKGQTQKKEPQ